MTIFTIALYTGFAALIWTFLEFSIKKTESFLLSWIKNWIGTFFIFSAVVKLVDPVGFSIKLTDYFNVFGTEFMNPYAQFLSFVLLVLEFMLGVALLFNAWKKVIYPILIALILFFTVLTGVSAIFNVVQDCGCFGDFLKISPWTSFIKDIILTAMVLLAYFNRKKFLPFFNNTGSALTIGISALAALAFTLHNYFHLPMWDFRAYKEGTYIPEKMKEIAPPTYENRLIYKHTATGEEQVFVNTTPTEEGWEFVEMEQKLIKAGIEAPIHDFTLTNNSGEDLTDQILNFEKPIILIVMHDAAKANNKGAEKIKALIEYSNSEDKYNYSFLSASPDAVIEKYKENLEVGGTNLTADATMLKTMIRSNPGIVLLEEGTILEKWHYNDIPDPEDILK